MDKRKSKWSSIILGKMKHKAAVVFPQGTIQNDKRERWGRKTVLRRNDYAGEEIQ